MSVKTAPTAGLRDTGDPWRIVGWAILGVVTAFAVLGPWLTYADPARQDLSRILVAPGGEYILGTDHLGRSVLSRLAYATRLSFGLALVSVVCAAVPGTILGVLAAWRGGWTERLLVSVSDSVLAIPPLLFVLLLLALAPGELWPFYLGLSLTLWVEYFRVVRAAASVLLNSPQVQASRLLGFGSAYVMRRHLWPELRGTLLTLMTFGAATAVLALATAGFIGVGLRPPEAELGVMMAEYFPYYTEALWLVGTPILLLIAIVAALAIIAKRPAGS